MATITPEFIMTNLAPLLIEGIKEQQTQISSFLTSTLQHPKIF
ncbi:MAG: hypothetical protein Q7S18_00190 [bacterium]|nr:hypothetical protein [bacterium]